MKDFFLVSHVRYSLWIVFLFIFASLSYLGIFYFQQTNLAVISFMRLMLDWGAFTVCLFIGISALSHYTIQREMEHAIFGIIFFLSGFLNAMYYISLSQLATLPLSIWWFVRLVFTNGLIVGAFLCGIVKFFNIQKRKIFLILSTLFLIYVLAKLKIIFLTLQDKINLPEDLLVFACPLLLMVFVLTFQLWDLYRKSVSFMILGLFLGNFIHILADGYVIWSYVNIKTVPSLLQANFLELVGFFPPMIGVIFDNLKSREMILEKKLIAEEASRLKSQFISSISHEFRSLVQIILGNFQLFYKEVENSLEFSQKQGFKNTQDAVNRLNALLDEITDLSKIEQGKVLYYPEKIDLKEILQKTLSTLEDKTAEKKVSINLEVPDSPLIVRMDFFRTSQVIYHVLNHLLQHASEKKIVIRTASDQKYIDVLFTDFSKELFENEIHKMDPYEKYKLKNGINQTFSLALVVAKKFMEEQAGGFFLKNQNNNLTFVTRFVKDENFVSG